jgi:maltokinase
VSPAPFRALEVNDALRKILADLVGASLARGRAEEPPDEFPELLPEKDTVWGATRGSDRIAILDAVLLQEGRPGLLDVVAETEGRRIHLLLGLRAPGDEAYFLSEVSEAVLGLYEDSEGLAVACDALLDAELVSALLRALDEELAGARVRRLTGDGAVVVFAVEDRARLTVFTELPEGGQPSVRMLEALDRVGFNHVPAPLFIWRRDGDDLGVLQEMLVGGTDGWSLARTSLRDLYASGCTPEAAGGDFAPEAHLLGTTTARMHLGLETAFGRRHQEISSWVQQIETSLRAGDPGVRERPEVQSLFAELHALRISCPVIRTHGDFHLGRVSRTEQGWFVSDLRPGGVPLQAPGPERLAGGEPPDRSPLADVADMLWSLRHVASTAATERDPTDSERLSAVASAWERRNRRAFLAGYLGVPGIAALLPPGRDTVRNVAAAFELHRAAFLLHPDATS